MEEVVGFGLHFALLSFVSFIVGKYYPDFEIYSAKIFFVVSLSLSLPFHCQHYCHIFHHFSNFAFRSHLIKTVTKSRFKNDSDDDDDESCLLKDFREKSIRNVEP